jgi:hypothetical protein
VGVHFSIQVEPASRVGLIQALGVMKIKTAHTQLYFDGNAQLAERAFALVQGTLDDLRAIGLSPQSALGARFTFVQEDEGPAGEPDALLFNGTIAHSPGLGHFILADSEGVRWLSEIAGHDA